MQDELNAPPPGSPESCSDERVARVVSVEGDDAFIQIEAGCGRCHEPGGCGGVSFSRIFSRAVPLYRVRNSCGARSGERVRVVMPAGALTRQAMLAYGLPLGGLLLGAVLGDMATGSDGGALGGGGLGLFLGWLALRIRVRRAGNSVDEPHIVRIDF